jgi:AbrB family looped-hinge helix DNA binding protein
MVITTYRCCHLTKTYAILDKTKVGRLNRTTIPEQVRALLQLKEGDEIVWVQDGNKVVVDRAKKEVE